VGSSGERALEDLAERLGHRFADETLLIRALTHGSYRAGAKKSATRDNERLEFLGDRVLGLVIAEMLFQKFPDSEEGGLAKRLNALVRKETCAEVARDIDLGAFMRLGHGEAKAGGRRKLALLGNACEAVIAALYLDGGFDAAHKFIERYWAARVDGLGKAPSDPKTALQEWCQARGLATPDYVVKEQSGPDHAPRFEVVVEVEGHERVAGIGSSKRAAETAAARALLAVLNAERGTGG